MDNGNNRNSAELTQPRNGQNNFGFLRTLFAMLVLFSHCFPLTMGHNNSEPLMRITRCMTLGSLAVNCFFAISGYLITLSWVRTPNAGEFLLKRIARVYPGYFVAFIVSILIGAMGSVPHAGKYWLSLVKHNNRLGMALLYLDHGALDQSTAFTENPFPHAINGSLWTLQPEIRCYLLILVFGLFGVLVRPRLVAGLFVIALMLHSATTICVGDFEFSIWRFIVYFLAGSIVAVYRLDRGDWLKWLQIVAALTLAISAYYPLGFVLVFPLAGTVLLFAAGFSRRVIAAHFFQRNDWSYGIYLYAFPVQQLLVQRLELRSPVVLFALALPVTVLCAWLSWNWIEAPILTRQRKIASLDSNGKIAG